jgi:hypothetical protein
MSDGTLPDLLVLGDSHSASLLAGARLLGLTADGLTFSGAAWHEGKFAVTRAGFEPRNAPAVRQHMDALRKRTGVTDVFASGPPVISTMGYHLGRLVPPFGWNGHVVPARDDDDAPTVSQAFLDAYVRHHREPHLRLARRLAARTRVVIVAPPPAFLRPSYQAFRDTVTGLFRAAGLTVHDPAADMTGAGGVLDSAYLQEDGIHGTAEYGATVLRTVMQRGLLGPAVSLQQA